MRHTQMILWAAVWLHGLWAVLLCFSTDPLGATTLHDYQAFFGNRWIIVAVLVTATAGAAWSLIRAQYGQIELAAMLLQQFLMLLSGASAAMAIFNSHFGDGVVRPRGFIAADQLAYLIVGVFHTWAVIQEWSRMTLGGLLARIKKRA